MAGSVNKVILIGNLGRDPEVRSFQNGGKVAELRIATSETWKDKSSGERKERTEWHTVKLFTDGLVTVAERYLRKGSKVYLEGALQTRKWQDQSGADRYSTEIVLQGFNATLTMLDGAPVQGASSEKTFHKGEEGHIPGFDPDGPDDGWPAEASNRGLPWAKRTISATMRSSTAYMYTICMQRCCTSWALITLG